METSEKGGKRERERDEERKRVQGGSGGRDVMSDVSSEDRISRVRKGSKRVSNRSNTKYRQITLVGM